jgi:hypothetical protein
MSSSNDDQQREVHRQVAGMLARSASYQTLPPEERAEIQRNTTAIVSTMVQNKMAQGSAPAARTQSTDPFAVPMGPMDGASQPGGMMPPGSQPGGAGGQQRQFTGGAQPNATKFGPTKVGDFGTAIATGVGQAGELLRQVNFPAFVAELVQGVFQAVVDASIQQMKAYGELVQSITMSLNDFRDANVTENQGRDHLVSKFPTLMQINMGDSGPRVGLRQDANTDDLPDIGGSLGLSEKVTDLDDETIEEKLVPAARNDLARSRQGLLATMLLMGINRIVVTDGKINAKLSFDFKARDSMTDHAQSYDYKNYGTSKATQSTSEDSEKTGDNYQETKPGWLSGGSRSGESDRWSKGTYQYTETPAIYLTAVDDKVTTAELEAKAKLTGEVSLNFKSETFDLNKLASADEVFRMERVRSSAGRGAPAPGAPAPGGKGGTAAASGNAAPNQTQTTTNNPPPAA